MKKQSIVAIIALCACASISGRCFERAIQPSDYSHEAVDEDSLAMEPRMLGMRTPDHRMPDVEKMRARMESLRDEMPGQDIDEEMMELNGDDLDAD